jgi:hypothetical protein
MGTNALPDLIATLSISSNDQQKALIYPLIGRLDLTLYGKLILATRGHSANDIRLAFKFVDTDVLKKLPPKQTADIVELFKRHYANFPDKLDAEPTYESLKANFPQEFGKEGVRQR